MFEINERIAMSIATAHTKRGRSKGFRNMKRLILLPCGKNYLRTTLRI